MDEASKKTKNESAHSHSGHRERVKKAILKNGFSHLYDHELLEFLLFYAIPRRDTNPIAHALIEEFGSLNAVLEADVDRIAACDGMGESSALMLKAVFEGTVRYVTNSSEPVYRYDKLSKVCKYLCNYYVGVKDEQAVALLFDNKMKLLDVVALGAGVVNASPIDLYRITEAVIKKHAAGVILAHNHPDGLLLPSTEDDMVTRKICEFLKQISIPLIEHVIISGNQAYPIMHYSGLYDVGRAVSDGFGETFIHDFFKPENTK